MAARQLRTLLAIVDQGGGFSRAAEVVHLTISAVSQQIQALKQEVSAELFDRSRRPLVWSQGQVARFLVK